MTALQEKLVLVNEALLGLRGTAVAESEFSADSSVPIARTAYGLFERAVENVLFDCNWRCVSKRSGNLEEAENPGSDYDYAYKLPSDFVKINGKVRYDGYLVEDRDAVLDGKDFMYGLDGSGNKIILTLYGHPEFWYVYKNFSNADYYGLMDGGLKEAIVLKLQVKLAYNLTSNASLVRVKMQEYEEHIRKARSWNKGMDALIGGGVAYRARAHGSGI